MRGNLEHKRRKPLDYDNYIEWEGETYHDGDLQGVSIDKYRKLAKPCKASIRHNGERMHLGYFATPQEAAAVYQAAREMILSGEWDRC